MSEPKILIVDLGSQYTLVIARTLRECGYRSVVLSPAKAEVWMEHTTPQSIILSGSDKSVHDIDAPQPPEGVLTAGVPILGICYGMQWFMDRLGGSVEGKHESAEYGPAEVTLTNDPLFANIECNQKVWASHGDSVLTVPEGTDVIAVDAAQETRAVHSKNHDFWGVQFHPEVNDTPRGKEMLLNFVGSICGCMPDWKPQDIVASMRKEISTHTNFRAVLGFSGGVDSTTMAAILAPAMGENLLGVCIDGGHLRKGERDEIVAHADAAGIQLKFVDAKLQFLKALRGITDAEKKRAAFKKVYLQILKDEIADFGATHIVQGTLATDEIESGVTGGHLIKSHHNVGLDWGNLGELKPLSPFFKYEVRALASELGLPQSVVGREPFPGPGLFLRIVGAEVTAERLDIVRQADYVVRKVRREFGQDVPEVSQLVVALMCLETTGVKGDGRTYKPSIAIRGVRTTDFMTANSVEFPPEFRRCITRLLTTHPEIVRVWWDETPKPPATTEFE